MVFTNILTKHQNNFIHTKCVVLLRTGGIYIRRRRSITSSVFNFSENILYRVGGNKRGGGGGEVSCHTWIPVK